MTENTIREAAVSSASSLPFLDSIAGRIAQDAEALAALHAAPLTADLLVALYEAHFPGCLGLLPATPQALAAWDAMNDILRQMQAYSNSALLDRLRAEYEATYVSSTLGATPNESLWINNQDDPSASATHLQDERLATIGRLSFNYWSKHPRSHVVKQLHSLSFLSQQARTLLDWTTIANMLDASFLHRAHALTAKSDDCSNLPFYPRLFVLTIAWQRTLRELLALHLNLPLAGPDSHSRHTANHETFKRHPRILPYFLT